eukprot:jgi/Mesvir1/25931/Mv20925-RA.1
MPVRRPHERAPVGAVPSRLHGPVRGSVQLQHFFLGMLLRDPGHLTTDPEQAHLFYAPLLPYRYSQNLGRYSPHIRDKVDAIMSMGYLIDRNWGNKDQMTSVYGMGIRAAFFTWLKENTGGATDVELHDEPIWGDYYNKLRSSKFCMDTAGHGFSVRILDYMEPGCIPVIIRDDILWPYESYELGGDGTENWQQDSAQGQRDDLPRVIYPEFVIPLRKKDIPAMLSMLRAISDDTLRHHVNYAQPFSS